MPFSHSEPGIVLIGYGDEPVMEYVLEELPDRDRFTFIALEGFEVDEHAYAYCDGGTLHLYCSTLGTVSIKSGTPVYGRIFVRPGARHPASVRRFIDEFVVWSEASPHGALIINRLINRGALGSKFAHLETLRAFGFRAPSTIISQSPTKLSAIAAPINKGVSATRTEAVRIDSGIIYNQRDAFELPVLVQQFIQGYDVRVHMLGSRHFALKIASRADDYRYARKYGHEVSFETINLPHDVIDQCWQYVRWAGIEFAGFDFKVDEAGKFWILECNAMPGFAYFDRPLDGAIVKALGEYLQGGYSHHHGSGTFGGTVLGQDRVPELKVGTPTGS